MTSQRQLKCFLYPKSLFVPDAEERALIFLVCMCMGPAHTGVTLDLFITTQFLVAKLLYKRKCPYVNHI